MIEYLIISVLGGAFGGLIVVAILYLCGYYK